MSRIQGLGLVLWVAVVVVVGGCRRVLSSTIVVVFMAALRLALKLLGFLSCKSLKLQNRTLNPKPFRV